MILPKLLLKCFYFWPFAKGRYRFFTLFSEATKSRIDQFPQPIRMKTGIKLFVRPGDHLSRWFRFFGDYEKSTSKMLRQYARKEEIFVDVGANLGLHSLGVAKDIGCHVAAFEPSPDTAGCLEKSILENHLSPRVKNFRIALSSEAGVADFIVPPAHVGQAALEAPVDNFRKGDRFEVEVVRLDDCKEFNSFVSEVGKRVGLIKMDIEGAEERALKGMKNLLLQHRPAIVMELYDGNLNGFNSSREKVISFLEGLNYRLDHEFEYNGLFLPCDTSNTPGHP